MDVRNEIADDLAKQAAITRMHGSAIRCVRSDSRSILNMANLTPL